VSQLLPSWLFGTWNTKAQRALSEAQLSLIGALKAELAAKDRQIAAYEGLLSNMRRIIAAQEGMIETLTERCAASPHV